MNPIRKAVVTAAAILLPLLPAALPADVHPNAESGFAPEKAFQAGEIDHVNLFNGNLVLNIPLGRTYPVGGGLRYGLALVYNSTPWDFQERHDPIRGLDYTQAFPSRSSNAGLGWRVSLDRLLQPGEVAAGAGINDSPRWIYVAADGSEHVFYNKLHEGDAEDQGDSANVQNVTYTRDGTYLRMKVVAGGREIEFPDGTVHKFDATRRLVQIRNRFNGTINVVYGSPWTITDSHGRVQKVFFTTLAQDQGSVEVVDRVELTAFGGAVATYTFGYTPATIRRPCLHKDPALSATAQVQLLTSLTLPDGSAYVIEPSDYIDDAPTTGPLCNTSGSIRELQLPTLGKIAWTYQEYTFPTESSNKPYRQKRAGVATRKALDAAGAPLGQWTYATAMTGTGPIYEELINSVTDPLGHKQVHHFSVYVGGSGTSTYLREDYSLPYSRSASDGSGRFVSVRSYSAAGTLLRTTYVRYQRDQASVVGDTLQDQLNINRREETARTVYHDDGDRYTEVNRSNFDGLGHYRQSQTGGSFASGDSQTAITSYNSAVGTYQLNASGIPQAGFTMLPSSSPWILDTYTAQTVTEGSSTEHSIFCFNSANGFLERKRVLLSSAAGLGNDDVLVLYGRDPGGNVTSEAWHGGDGGGLSKTDTCSFTPPAADYRIDHTWQYGELATSQHAGVGFKSLDRTIDSRTGLPSSSRDTAGLQTAYEYDGMGRILWSMPALGHGGWTEYVYNRATSSSSLAQVIVRRRGNGARTAAVISPRQVHFDALGRIWKELTFLPGNVWSVRETRYNEAGLKSQVSEPYALGTTPSNWTRYLNYDPFGRPGTVRPPDGLAHDVTFSRYGVRLVSRTAKVGTAYNAATAAVTESAATTTETYDHHGRLYKVVEPSGPGGADVTTTYTYDAGNRMTNAKTEAAVTQDRWFNYDGRGFLTGEFHPEKGIAGNGKVEYTKHDARGHAGRVVDGPNDLTYTYDAAERVSAVDETGGRPLKDLIYDTGAGWGNGKVAQAVRYNYPLLGTAQHTAQITETYSYGGVDGRPSQRVTAMAFNGTAAETFTQSFSWTSLGDVATLGYPRCIHNGCAASSPRTVTNGYTNATLISVASDAGTYGTINYHVNGMIDDVTHANGVTDMHAVDPFAMRRPASITSAAGTAIRWTTGSYAYDGSGNITKMGTAWFTYDKVSRLTTGTVFTGATGGGTQKQQTYTFDPFGNLTEIGGTSGRNVPVNAALNRLSAAGVTYDAAGNLTQWNGNLYQHDPFGLMWKMKSGTEEWLYVYTADGERVWSFKVGANFSRWTLRDLSGRVLREYNNNQGAWSVAEDYLYRGGLLLAAETPSGRRHFHLDHLGTPRLVTDAAGVQVAYHVYYPFGEEATAFNQDAERLKLTGHERDLASLAGSGDDLDYMHARFCSPITNRFLSPDPVGGKPGSPQSWNRYAYTIGNPLKYVDPDGRSIWRTSWKIIVQSAKGTRTVVTRFRGTSKQQVVERTKKALDTIDNRQRSQGAKRVVQAESEESAQALGKQLSPIKKARGPEQSGRYPEHFNPEDGPYEDVHIETTHSESLGMAAVATQSLGEILAPATSAVVESGDATPGELLSAGAWDLVTTLDPTGLSDAINWYFDVD